MNTLCERCNGTGMIIGYGCPGFLRIEISCRECDGTGQLTPERQERIAKAKALRDSRVARGVSLREEAKALGISPLELSERERGLR